MLVRYCRLVLLMLHTVMTEQSHVVVPTRPIVVRLGGDVLLECQLVPVVSLNNLEVRWFRSSQASPVHLYTGGRSRPDVRDEGYQGRTELFQEEFPRGNASLRLRRIKRSDEGNYTCSIESSTFREQGVLRLQVEAFSEEFFSKVNIWLVLFWVLAVLVVPAAVFDVMMHRKEDKMIKELQLLCTLEGHDDVDVDYVPVTLDVESAGPELEVSEDRISVRRTGIRRNLPDTGKRFTDWPCVLGSEGFTSGRHYWEVEVTGNEDWRVGVAEESVVRDGWVSVLPSNGYWTIGRDGDLLYAVNCPPSRLTASPIPDRIGVYLNYESGSVSFHIVETKSYLHSFTGNTFTGKLYPFFWTGDENQWLRICSSSTLDI